MHPSPFRNPPGVVVAALVLVLAFSFQGCTKRVTFGTTEVDIGDGRRFELGLAGERSINGRLVPGSNVRYVQGDSLFDAEVEAVTDEFIELSRRVLITDLDEWTPLRRAAEDAQELDEGPELGGTLIARDEIQSIAVLTLDRRRLVTESVFWAALVIAVGFAGLR